MLKAFLSVVLLSLLVGCATGSPPTATERALFEFRTNIVDRVVWKTNVVTVIDPVTGTNIVRTVVSETNQVEVLYYQPRQAVSDTVTAVGIVASPFGFGISGAISSVVLAIYGGWATWRSGRYVKLAAVLGQNIEVGRETIKALASAPVETRYVEVIKSAQVVAGVKPEAGNISHSKVNTLAATNDAAYVIKAKTP